MGGFELVTPQNIEKKVPTPNHLSMEREMEGVVW